jgi:UPF0755 protein
MKNAVSTTIVILFLGVIGTSWYIWDHFVNSPNSDSNEEVIYEVPPKTSFTSVAKTLEKRGVIKNAELFTFFARIRGGAGRMKIGEYSFRKNMRPSEVLNILISGRSIEHKITIPEGFNIYEIADSFEDSGIAKRGEFLKIVKDPALVQMLLGENYSSLEGYLYPETYKYTKFTDVKTLVVEMVKNFNQVYDELIKQFPPNGMTKNEIVTLASIVEKETGAGFERPLVASVFYNRMKKKMRLQTDPTIIYGIADLTGKIPDNIHKADITRPTRYNTYVINGLPPGPICNPGKEALAATLHPGTSEYLYFVSYNDGTHKFSKDFREHNQAVKKYQLDPKARSGKSWRDLKNQKSATH